MARVLYRIYRTATRKHLPVLAAAALLAGCAAGPDFVRPQVPQHEYTKAPLPASTKKAGAPAAGNAQAFRAGAPVPQRWWAEFDSAALSRKVELALMANPDIRTAEANLREAAELLKASEGAFFPAVDANIGVSRGKGTTGAATGPRPVFNLYNASVAVAYTPDVFGGVRRGVEAQAALRDIQYYQLQAARLAIAGNVVTAAIQEASLREQIAATQDIVAVQRHEMDVMRKNYELGGAAKTAVLAQQTALAQSEALLPPLQKQLERTRNLMRALQGRFPDEEDGPDFKLAEIRLPAELPVTLPSQLVEQRPDIRAAEANLHVAAADVGIAAANMLPQITLGGQAGYSAGRFGDLFTPSGLLWSLSAGVLQPVFHGWSLFHQHRAAEAAWDAAAAQYSGTVLTAFHDVSDTLNALSRDADALAAQTAAESAARQNLDLVQKQYDMGAIDYLTLLDAQRSVQQTRIDLIQAEATRLADTAALYVALGGGWYGAVEEARQEQAQAAEKPAGNE
jgi:NodT family efflux transporter outer membrane factor (OMF) lipoprotein